MVEQHESSWHEGPVSWFQLIIALIGILVAILTTWQVEKRAEAEENRKLLDRITILEQRQQNVLSYINDDKNELKQMNTKLDALLISFVQHAATTPKNGSPP